MQTIRAFQATVDANSPEELESVVQEKLALLTELEHGIKARNQLQQSLGLTAGLEGGTLFLRQHKAPESVMQTWQKLLDLSAKVEQLNNQNGQLALQGERTTREALGILTGRKEDNDTYGKGRRGKSRLDSYTLAKV